MRNLQSGFTLIELVLVIVIIGVLSALAVPQFVDIESNAVIAAKKALGAETRSGLNIVIADRAAQKAAGISVTSLYPTVTELAASLQPQGTAAATGVQFNLNGTTVTATTYTDSACATATAAVTGLVRCVKNPT